MAIKLIVNISEEMFLKRKLFNALCETYISIFNIKIGNKEKSFEMYNYKHQNYRIFES
jgi:uncharacterized protein Veg